MLNSERFLKKELKESEKGHRNTLAYRVTQDYYIKRFATLEQKENYLREAMKKKPASRAQRIVLVLFGYFWYLDNKKTA